MTKPDNVAEKPFIHYGDKFPVCVSNSIFFEKLDPSAPGICFGRGIIWSFDNQAECDAVYEKLLERFSEEIAL